MEDWFCNAILIRRYLAESGTQANTDHVRRFLHYVTPARVDGSGAGDFIKIKSYIEFLRDNGGGPQLFIATLQAIERFQTFLLTKYVLSLFVKFYDAILTQVKK